MKKLQNTIYHILNTVSLCYFANMVMILNFVINMELDLAHKSRRPQIVALFCSWRIYNQFNWIGLIID